MKQPDSAGADIPSVHGTMSTLATGGEDAGFDVDPFEGVSVSLSFDGDIPVLTLRPAEDPQISEAAERKHRARLEAIRNMGQQNPLNAFTQQMQGINQQLIEDQMRQIEAQRRRAGTMPSQSRQPSTGPGLDQTLGQLGCGGPCPGGRRDDH